jgi:hypothetical protein
LLTIDNLATSDGYTDALTIFSELSHRLAFVVANASVRAQFRPAKSEALGHAQPFANVPEVLITPTSGTIDRISGVRFRSAVTGSPARIIAQLVEPADIFPGSGLPFTQVLTAQGGVSNLVGELNYKEVSPVGDFTVSGSEAAPQTLVTFDAITYDGVTAVEFELFSPGADATVANAANELGISLWSGTDALGGADLGRMFHVLGANSQGGVYGRRRLAPAAGSAQFRIRAWRVTNNYTLRNNAGGVGVYMPTFGRIYV